MSRKVCRTGEGFHYVWSVLIANNGGILVLMMFGQAEKEFKKDFICHVKRLIFNFFWDVTLI